MQPSKDELRRALDILKPFFAARRQRWCDLIIKTAPNQTDEREQFYAMINGLNGVENDLAKAAAPEPETATPAVATGWNGLPME